MVAIELKIGVFEAEYAGKMQLYLAALDEQVKLPDENPPIGIIICKSSNSTRVHRLFHLLGSFMDCFPLFIIFVFMDGRKNFVEEKCDLVNSVLIENIRGIYEKIKSEIFYTTLQKNHFYYCYNYIIRLPNVLFKQDK